MRNIQKPGAETEAFRYFSGGVVPKRQPHERTENETTAITPLAKPS
jgi:hypothetical protein